MEGLTFTKLCAKDRLIARVVLSTDDADALGVFGYRAVTLHEPVDAKEHVALLRLALHSPSGADAMIVGMDDERLTCGVEAGGLHLMPKVAGGEKLDDEFRGQLDGLTRAVGEAAVVVTAGPFLDRKRPEALHRHAAVVALAEHITHLVEEGGEHHLASGDADATAFRYGQRKLV